MTREITQRELRNDSGHIMRQLDQGETFVVTRNGVPVGELTPLRRHRLSVPRQLLPSSAMPHTSISERSAPTLTPSPSKNPLPVPDEDRPSRGVLDTSVVIDFEDIDPSRLPGEVAISAITLAELAAGPHATTDADERAPRQDRLQRAEAAFDPWRSSSK